jgi:hypothetical protein
MLLKFLVFDKNREFMNIQKLILGFLVAITGTLYSSESLSSSVLIGGSMPLGTVTTQLTKVLADNYVETLNSTNSFDKLIRKTTLTLFLKEATKECVQAMLPKAFSKGFDEGTKTSLTIDLYMALMKAQQAFPLYPELASPMAQEPCSTSSPLDASWRLLPSSTALDIAHHPTNLSLIMKDFHFGSQELTTFNLGLLHSVVGFGSAAVGKIIATALVTRSISAAEQRSCALQFKTIMAMTTIAFTEWINEGLRCLVEDNPSSPAQEARFYEKMHSLGAKLFITIDKIIALV